MKRLKEFIRSVPDYSRTGRGGCSIEYLAHNCLNNIRTAFNNQNLLRFNIMINKRLSIFLKSCKSSDNNVHPPFVHGSLSDSLLNRLKVLELSS